VRKEVGIYARPNKLHRSFALLRMTRHKLGGRQATQILYNRLGLKERQFERCCLISIIMSEIEKPAVQNRPEISATTPIHGPHFEIHCGVPTAHAPVRIDQAEIGLHKRVAAKYLNAIGSLRPVRELRHHETTE